METITLLLFCLILLISLIFNISLVLALLLGLMIFITYCLLKSISIKDIISMCKQGIYNARNILLTFILIGMLSSMLRATGTIGYIVVLSSKFLIPSLFILIAFLLNCLISFLTGTSFGSAATIGIVCTTIASSLNMNMALIGGAVLSGIYFGDRCSYVSTSALLVSNLTNTNIYDNVKQMLKSSLIPFIITCIIYTILGLNLRNASFSLEVLSLFETEFQLNIYCLLPALSILIFSFLKCNVKTTMIYTIIISIIVCFFIQDIAIHDIFSYLIYGYKSRFVESTMLEGGGIVSMFKVGSIVCISSCYAGIFEKTPLLDKIKEMISLISHKTSSIIAITITSILSLMIACNQTLGIMMTHQLCKDLKDDLMLDLENTVVLIAGLVPWCIACAVPLATINVPASSIFYACFLYLVPLYSILKRIS